MLGARDCPSSAGVGLECIGQENQCGVAIAYVPFGAQGAGDVWGACAVFFGCWNKREYIGDLTVFAGTVGWAPAADVEAKFERKLQRGLIDAGLSARDNF